MAEKGDNTRKMIVKNVAGLFSQKGYSAVTMKDVCDTCGLSRGGLYRHFGSTKEIFIEVLEQDSNDAEESINQAIASGLSAEKLLSSFFFLQKNDIIITQNRIEVAIYEFCIANPDQKKYLEDRFQVAIHTFARLIDYGQEQKVFKPCDSVALGRHIVMFLEGLKMTSIIKALPEELLNQQFKMLYQMVVGVEKIH